MEVRAYHPAGAGVPAARVREPAKTGTCTECGGSTRDGKPWCEEHLALSPYVAEILAREARRAGELVARPKDVALDGPCADDVMAALRGHGSCTLERLARDANVPEPIVADLVRRLRRAGVVRLGLTKRGSVRVQLLEEPRRTQVASCVPHTSPAKEVG